MLNMSTTAQIKTENHPPWEDWEDHGGFDDEESLMGRRITLPPAPFQERQWYYEKKRGNKHQTITVSIQMSFL